MERVGTLLQKLQEQYERKAPADQLLLTIQQLQSELQHLQNGAASNEMISVEMPAFNPIPPTQPVNEQDIPPKEAERTVEILQVDEAEIEAELEEMRRKADEMQRMSKHSKPTIVFEPEEEEDIIPTLAHQENKPVKEEKQHKPQKEVHETITEHQTSLNDKLRQGTMELGDQHIDAPIRDLRKAIGVNDRFLYIKELFRGDEVMYERSIKTINGFSILPEAEYWIQRELKVKLGWNDSSETLKQFNQLIKRRFT